MVGDRVIGRVVVRDMIWARDQDGIGPLFPIEAKPLCDIAFNIESGGGARGFVFGNGEREVFERQFRRGGPSASLRDPVLGELPLRRFASSARCETGDPSLPLWRLWVRRIIPLQFRP